MKNTDSTNKRGNCPVPRADWAINISADDAKQEAEQMEADFAHLHGECLDEKKVTTQTMSITELFETIGKRSIKGNTIDKVINNIEEEEKENKSTASETELLSRTYSI